MFFKKSPQQPVRGIIRTYEVPFETEEEFRCWWHRFTPREKGRLLVYETHNLITQLGLNNINAYYAATGSIPVFALYFAVGANPISGVLIGDTSLAGEVFRKVPTSSTIVNNVITNSTYFGPTEGGHSGTNPVTYTNAGLFGNGATSTSGSGQLNTHAPYAYTKPYNQAITNDYPITRT